MTNSDQINDKSELEDFVGGSLKKMIPNNNFSLLDKLAIAIDISKELANIHFANIFHGNIHSTNILINSDNRQIKIIHDDSYRRFSQSASCKIDPIQMKDRLNYLSPEQTGLMNRMVDYRTDFYSLGVTLYELFTHTLPFDSNDDNEVIHNHIALEAKPLFKIIPEIPKPVNDIVMILLKKMPEDRYQRATDISLDLTECYNQLKTKQKIDTFELSQSKCLGTFSISQKLYERENEKQLLIDTFERVCNGGRELIFVSGYPGIGKTKLIKEMYRPVIQKKGFFIYGKFDQLQHEIPHNAWISAFKELIHILLTENPDQIKKWKTTITRALGCEAHIMINMIPELEKIIGPQKLTIKSDPEKILEDSFYYLFIKFIGVFCQYNHPLTIFIDDAQWIDSGSLKLLEAIITEPTIQNLFIIVAFRDNEVNASHTLNISIEKLEKTKAPVQHIHLSNLNHNTITLLISDSLHTEKESILSLSEVIVQKTNGNPMFSIEFLRSIHSEKLLTYDTIKTQWKWDEETIQKRMVEENVADILAKRMKQLKQTTIDLLKMASCLSSKFDLLLLSIISKNDPLEISKILEEAVAEQLIIPLFTSSAFLYANKDDIQTYQLDYKFSHDRIKDAAYSLIPEKDKPETHWQIGIQLYETTSDNDVLNKKYCYIMIENLNRGKKTIDFQNYREILAKLNLDMAKKARESFEYKMTYRYSTTGIDCIPEKNWESLYTLSYELYWQAAEAAYLTGNYAEMNCYIETLLEYVKTEEEEAKVLLIKLMAMTTQNKLKEALETGIIALDLLGIKLPSKITKLHLLFVYYKMKLLFRPRKIESLYNLPEMTDPTKKLILRITTILCFSAYYTCPELLVFTLMISLDILTKYGTDRNISPVLHCGFAFLISAIIEKYDTAYKLGYNAFQSSRKFYTKEFDAKTIMIFAHFILPWTRHLKESLKPLMDAFQSGIETGAVEYAANSIYLYNVHLFISGEKLSSITSQIDNHKEIFEKLNQPMTFQMLKIYWQTVSNFIDPPDAPGLLNGTFMNENDLMSSQYKDVQAIICNMYNCKLVLCYFFGDYQNAISCTQISKHYLNSLIGTFAFVVYCFYSTLTEFAMVDESSLLEKMKVLAKTAGRQKKLKNWSKQSKHNFLHKFYLVKAERYRLLGKNQKAILFYEKAIHQAGESKYIHIEALANELLARFYYNIGKINFARAYIQDAYYCYFQWGAIAKVKDIENRYSHIIFDVPSDFNKNLDIQSLIKASQAISKEIDLEKLLKALMEIVIVTAGAQSGIFLLKKNNQLVLAANTFRVTEASNQYDTTYYSNFSSLEECNDIDFEKKIIYYVDRTSEMVVLDETNKQRFLSDDSYSATNSPLSVFCLPILEEKKLTGILYLENRLSNDIFSEQKIKILKILSSQIAISIKNSNNYEKLKQDKRTLEEQISNASVSIFHNENRINLGKAIEKIADIINNKLSIIKLKEKFLLNYFLKNNLSDYSGLVKDMVENVNMIGTIHKKAMEYSNNPEDSLMNTNLELSIHLILSFFKSFLHAHNIRLEVEISEGVPEVYLNPVQFQQIVIYLLSNAIFAVNDNSQILGAGYRKLINISLSYENKKDHIIFKFKDNGVGMNPEILKRCFDPFFTTRKLSQGIGLDLSIVKKIVEENNMKIEVDSIEGEGTLFTIYICRSNRKRS